MSTFTVEQEVVHAGTEDATDIPAVANKITGQTAAVEGAHCVCAGTTIDTLRLSARTSLRQYKPNFTRHKNLIYMCHMYL